MSYREDVRTASTALTYIARVTLSDNLLYEAPSWLSRQVEEFVAERTTNRLFTKRDAEDFSNALQFSIRISLDKPLRDRVVCDVFKADDGFTIVCDLEAAPRPATITPTPNTLN